MSKQTVGYEMTYSSGIDRPMRSAKHTDQLVAADDTEALQKFNDLKNQYVESDDFKLFKITSETWTSQRENFLRQITVIIKTQLA